MNMTVEDMMDILNGMVSAGMGECEIRIKLTNYDFKTVTIDSATFMKAVDGRLVPLFNGSIEDVE